MIAVTIEVFEWKWKKADGKPVQDMEKFVFDAADGVNICGSDHVIGQEQDQEGTGW